MNGLKTAVIMAGGQGTRLANITGALPKAMVNIRGTDIQYFGKAKDTILEHQMKILSENGINNFILVVGNKREYIKNAFTKEIINQLIPGRDIKISFFEEKQPLGTAGSFCSKSLQEMIKEKNFLFTYSDILFDVNLNKMHEFHLKNEADTTILISPTSQPDDRDLFVFGRDNIIKSMIPKQGKSEGQRGSLFPNTPKNGIMILNKRIFNVIPEEPTYLDMEDGIISKLIYGEKHKVCAWLSPAYTKDIGTIERFREGIKDLQKGLPALRNPAKTAQKCVVYDENDLAIIDSQGFISLNEQIVDSMTKLNEKGIITFLYKNNKILAKHSKEDWIIDTMLIREGKGAYVNGRFTSEQIPEFYQMLEDWNIDKTNAYSIQQASPIGCLVKNLGTKEMQVQSNFIGAAYTVLDKYNPQSPVAPFEDFLNKFF